MIGPRVIQTAAHCLVLNGVAVNPSAVTFAAGADLNGSPKSPFGVCKGIDWLMHKKYLSSQNSKYDWALVKLDCSVGNMTGFFGFKAKAKKRQRTNIWGYPGDKPWPRLYKDSCRLKGVTKRQISYKCDTFGGQSGSGVWKKFSGCGRCVFGVHTLGGTRSNAGTKLKKIYIDAMRAWRRM